MVEQNTFEENIHCEKELNHDNSILRDTNLQHRRDKN